MASLRRPFWDACPGTAVLAQGYMHMQIDTCSTGPNCGAKCRKRDTVLYACTIDIFNLFMF